MPQDLCRAAFPDPTSKEISLQLDKNESFPPFARAPLAEGTGWFVTSVHYFADFFPPLLFQLDIVEFIPSLLYFGYTALMVLSFWLLTGTIGFYAAYMFVRKIYAAVKID